MKPDSDSVKEEKSFSLEVLVTSKAIDAELAKSMKPDSDSVKAQLSFFKHEAAGLVDRFKERGIKVEDGIMICTFYMIAAFKVLPPKLTAWLREHVKHGLDTL